MPVQAQFGPKLTPAVKALIIIQTAIFLLILIINAGLSSAGSSSYNQLEYFFALVPPMVMKGFIWQIFTYQFIHAGFMHLIFNMFALWMFGSDLESLWGKKRFLKYYLVCGTGAGVFIFLLPFMLSQPASATVGSSGAVFGLLLAYAVHWPERQLLFMMIFPVKVKYFVLGIGLISLYFTFAESGGGTISHVGHLGGLITGYLYLLATENRPKQQFEKVHFWNIPQRLRNAKKKREWEKKRHEMFEDMHREEKLDHILDKIAKNGMKSLTKAEKNFLKTTSIKMGKREDS